MYGYLFCPQIKITNKSGYPIVPLSCLPIWLDSPFKILEGSAHRCTCTTPPFTSTLLASINRNMSGNIHSFASFSVIYFTP